MWNVLGTLPSLRQRGEWAGWGKVVLLLLQEHWQQPQHGLHEQTHAGQTAPASHHSQLAVISLPVQNPHPEELSEQSSHRGEIVGHSCLHYYTHFRPENPVSDLREAPPPASPPTSPPASPWNIRSSSRVNTPLRSAWRLSLQPRLVRAVRAGQPLWCRQQQPQSGGTTPASLSQVQQHSHPTPQSFPVLEIPSDFQTLEAGLLNNPIRSLYDYNQWND